MKDLLYSWIRDIAFYTLLMTVTLHVLPEKEQRKYLQFFMGVVLIILVLSPVLKAAGLEQRLDEAYSRQSYDLELQQFQQQQEELMEHYQELTEEKIQEETEAAEESEEEEEEIIAVPEIHIEIGTTEKD